MHDVTIAVCTFGDDQWRQLAAERAVPSAEQQGVPVVIVHRDSLHAARNAALDEIGTGHVVYLDADDELEPGFIDRLAAGTADLRAPAVRYVRDGWPAVTDAAVPKVWGHDHVCEPACLAAGNWLVVGAWAPVDLIRKVGGWRDWPCYEDYDLWARCWLAGATIEAVPGAVYRAYVRPDSRNRGGDPLDRAGVHRAIAADLGLQVPA